jgi:hypothetical protein
VPEIGPVSEWRVIRPKLPEGDARPGFSYPRLNRYRKSDRLVVNRPIARRSVRQVFDATITP